MYTIYILCLYVFMCVYVRASVASQCVADSCIRVLIFGKNICCSDTQLLQSFLSKPPTQPRNFTMHAFAPYAVPMPIHTYIRVLWATPHCSFVRLLIIYYLAVISGQKSMAGKKQLPCTTTHRTAHRKAPRLCSTWPWPFSCDEARGLRRRKRR